MSRHSPTNASIFTQHSSPPGIIQIHLRCRIIMQIKHIATRIMIAATRRVYQTGRIISFGPLRYFRSLELSPCLIKRNPGSDAWIRIQTIHDFFPLFPITSFRFSRTFQFCPVKIFPVLPFRITVSAWHILPYDNPQLVAIGIPSGRFYFDMLANHIKAEVFRLPDVINQSFIGRCGIKTIGPPSLIQRTKLEQRFIIQLQTNYSI